MTFTAAKWHSSSAPKKSFCRPSYPFLLRQAHIFLWRSLYAFAAGLNFYKMYSVSICRDDVNLKMSRPEVALEDNVSLAFKQAACEIFSLSPRYLSFISAIFHSPSTSFNTAILFLVFPQPSPIV